MHNRQQQRRWLILLAGLVEGGLGILAWVLGWWLDQPCWATLYWNAVGVLWGVAACSPMLLLFLLCLSVPVGPLARIKRFSEEIVRPLFEPCTLLDLAFIAMLAGFGEELLFRGVLQTAFSNWFNPCIGLATASILFGLLHPITPTYILLAALMGFYLGYVWMASGNLLVVIVAHGLYDFLVLVVLVRGPFGKRPRPTTEGPSAEAVPSSAPPSATS
jgi:membrane protease YdiL (CAAX protease family)